MASGEGEKAIRACALSLENIGNAGAESADRGSKRLHRTTNSPMTVHACGHIVTNQFGVQERNGVWL